MPFFKMTPIEDLRKQVQDFVTANPDGWVIDGNYRNQVSDITWDNASDIIWLDYPIYIPLWRLLFRTLWRITYGVKLWGKNGCVETWKSQFFSRDSLLFVPFDITNNDSLWVIWFYRFRRPVFYEEFIGKKKGRFEGKNILWLQQPNQAENLIKTLPAA
jgi:hypothetical protein